MMWLTELMLPGGFTVTVACGGRRTAQSRGCHRIHGGNSRSYTLRAGSSKRVCVAVDIIGDH